MFSSEFISTVSGLCYVTVPALPPLFSWAYRPFVRMLSTALACAMRLATAMAHTVEPLILPQPAALLLSVQLRLHGAYDFRASRRVHRHCRHLKNVEKAGKQ